MLEEELSKHPILAPLSALAIPDSLIYLAAKTGWIVASPCRQNRHCVSIAGDQKHVNAI